MAIPSSCGSRIWFQPLRIHLLSRILCCFFFPRNWLVLAGYPISACPPVSLSLCLSLSPFLFLFSFFSPHLLLVPRPTHRCFSHYCFFPSGLAFCVSQAQGLSGSPCSASGTICHTGWGTLLLCSLSHAKYRGQGLGYWSIFIQIAFARHYI